MFEQTLNLLPQKYRKVHVPFGYKKVIAVTLGSTGVALLSLGFVGFLEYRANQELEQYTQQQQAANLALDEFRAQNSRESLDETIAVRIQKYEDLLRLRQNFLKRINGENFGNTRGFSEYLLALARQKFPEIWIEELVIQGDAKAFGLKGKAVNPTHITELLKSLQAEPAMNGIVFDDLTLTREIHPKGDFVSFSISYGDFSGLGSGFQSSLADIGTTDVGPVRR